jgi:hypothetical protein
MTRSLVAALLLVPALACAQDSGAYAAVDIAYSRISLNTSQNESTAYGAHLGLFASRNLALELGYRELGDFGGFTASATSLAGLWLVPANDRLDFYVKVGIARTEAEARGFSDTRNGALVGFGVQYDLARALFGRLSWERYPKSGGSTTGEGRVDVFALGAGVRF